MDPSNLHAIDKALLEAYRRLGIVLRSSHGGGQQMHTQNDFGDVQLDTDMKCEAIVNEELQKTGLVAYVLSEETPKLTQLGNDKAPYIVTFDPLDGSSIIGCNWTVGTIVGVWTNDDAKLIGKKGKELLSASCCLYGSRISALMYNHDKDCVDEHTFIDCKNAWEVTKHNIRIKKQAKLFAPGNLRAVAENEAYKKLVDYWVMNGYTLRYTGGMVPDIYQIFVKEQGIFTNMISEKNPAKLRYLYEVAPLSFLVENQKAGGKSTTGSEGVLEQVVSSYGQKSAIAVGSEAEIERIVEYYKN